MSETGANCGTVIGNLETPHVWKNQTVCGVCAGGSDYYSETVMSDSPAPDPFFIETREGAIIVRVNLKLFDDMHIDAMNELIDQAADKPGVSVVVLDMSRVQIIPSIGIGVLIQLSKKCKARQQKLKVAAVRPQVVEALGIAKMNAVLDLIDTVEAGIS